MERFVVDRLRESLGDGVTTATDAEYDTLRRTFNATVQRRPAVIVRAQTDDDAHVIWARLAAEQRSRPGTTRTTGFGST